MKNFQLTLAYDGTHYHGWQRQPGVPTIQQTLEEALQRLTGEQLQVFASGRTDAGVHALGQVAHFKVAMGHEADTIQRALNGLLPEDIRIKAVKPAAASFHANYSAKAKLYRYAIWDSEPVLPMLRHHVYLVKKRLDCDAMYQASRCLVGEHDFSSFETSGAPRATSIRKVLKLDVFRGRPGILWESDTPVIQPRPVAPGSPDGPLIYLEISANGFLYNMVRAIAGSLILVGRGYWEAGKIAEALGRKDRVMAGPTAQAHGLYLVRVLYPS